jgi:hypothetical protein
MFTNLLLIAKGSRKNNFAELALRFGTGLADPREQNHRKRWGESNTIILRQFLHLNRLLQFLSGILKITQLKFQQ